MAKKRGAHADDLVLDPRTADRALELIKRRYTQLEIARIFNREFPKLADPTFWSQSKISRLLKNREKRTVSQKTILHYNGDRTLVVTTTYPTGQWHEYEVFMRKGTG